MKYSESISYIGNDIGVIAVCFTVKAFFGFAVNDKTVFNCGGPFCGAISSRVEIYVKGSSSGVFPFSMNDYPVICGASEVCIRFVLLVTMVLCICCTFVHPDNEMMYFALFEVFVIRFSSWASSFLPVGVAIYPLTGMTAK